MVIKKLEWKAQAIRPVLLIHKLKISLLKAGQPKGFIATVKLFGKLSKFGIFDFNFYNRVFWIFIYIAGFSCVS